MKYKSKDNINTIKVNSGDVKYICTDSTYTVRYPDAMKNYVTITEQDNVLDIHVSWQLSLTGWTADKTLRINLKGITGCTILQSNGNADVESCIPINSFNLINGNLTVNTENIVTTIDSKVSNGTLANKSDLHVTKAKISHGAKSANWLSGQKSHMVLSGDNQHTEDDYGVRNFCVGNGNLTFKSYTPSLEHYNIDADQEYVDVGLVGSSSTCCCTCTLL